MKLVSAGWCNADLLAEPWPFLTGSAGIFPLCLPSCAACCQGTQTSLSLGVLGRSGCLRDSSCRRSQSKTEHSRCPHLHWGEPRHHLGSCTPCPLHHYVPSEPPRNVFCRLYSSVGQELRVCVGEWLERWVRPIPEEPALPG